MVLPERILSVGGDLASVLSAAVSSVHVLKVRDLGGLAGSSTTDLVRFSGTLNVARSIVEQQKRADIIEVPRTGLESVLDRIKALEEEVQDMLDGKQVSKSSDAIEPSAAGSSSPAASSSAGSSPKGSSSGGSPSATTSDAGSSDRSSSGEDDCAPEQLLYRLGGGSLQRRSMTVSEHPLFRRNTKCTLDAVSGTSEEKKLPSGGAVFKESSGATDSASAAGTESTNGATTAANPNAADKDGSKGSAEEETITTTLTSTSYSTVTVHLQPAITKAGSSGKYVNDTALTDAPKRPTASGGDLFKNGTAIPTGTETALASTVLAGQGGLAQADETAPPSSAPADEEPAPPSSSELLDESRTSAPIFQKNATPATASASLSIASGLSSFVSDSQPSDAAPSAGSKLQVGNTDGLISKLLHPKKKNDTAPSTTMSPLSGFPTLSPVGSADLKFTTAVDSQPLSEKNAPAPADQATALFQSATTPAFVDEERSTSALQDASSPSAAAGEDAPVPEASPRTSTVTSTITSTLAAAAADAATEPEATTSALVSEPAMFKDTLEKRASGFKTVRTLRDRTPAADE